MRDRWTGLALLTGGLAGLAFLLPLWAPEPTRAGALLLYAGAVTEAVQGFRRRTAASQRQAWFGAGLTLLLGILLGNIGWLAGAAITIIVAIPFAIDAIRYVGVAIRNVARGESPTRAAAAAAGNLAVTLGLFLLGRFAFNWVIAVAAGMRLAGTAINLVSAPVYTEDDADESVIADIGIDRPERLTETVDRIQREEANRSTADAQWILALLFVLFMIHVSRMGFDRSTLGILSPVVAVLGDIVFAVGLTYAVIIPFRLGLRRATMRQASRGWEWILSGAPERESLVRRGLRGAVRYWLESRMRLSLRLRSARYSIRTAFGRGLHIGLPLAAVLTASVPVWGMSWYFDTENWAAGIWDSWVAARTDTWRAAMVRGVVAAGHTTLDGNGFAVVPPGLTGAEPFSFMVIGDTGEGDASQHVLRDSLLRASAAPDVRFVVVSSDVIYPTGAMKDYEPRFWLPFKGVTKPVYAIPGNHDWYDVLDGFIATFFDPAAARTAMRARIAEDQGISSTTDAQIERFISTAGFLRQQYGVPTGFQQAPFFQVQTPGFVLLAVDTGVVRGVDDEEMKWLRAALEASRGKVVMALLGHPFLAGGHDTSIGDDKFTIVRDLMREFDVRLIMAGDTHDLEYYAEKSASGRTVHHWVNGGGGAYLSFGAALSWPKPAAADDWAFYPGRAAVVQKIERLTPWWKRPAWWWTRDFNAWPSSAEWLSAMFDYNSAPFFQSFVVVTFDPGSGRVTVKPWGIHGPLTWGDLDRSAGALPAGAGPGDPVIWTIEK
jgi:hypothetical protein